MIGKIFYQTKWCLCRYENSILDILHNTCSAPRCILQSKISYNISSVIAAFEDGSICFFDIRDATALFNVDEYVADRFYAPNYFKTNRIKSNGIKSIKKIKKVTFKNGVLKPMLELSHIPKFDVEIEGVVCKVCFCIKKKSDDFLCKMKYGRNTIHGQSDLKFNKDIAKYGATLAVMSMYLYILDECGAENSTKFNFIQCAFA